MGGEVVGQSKFESESPLSVPLGHLSPKGETIFYMYALFVFVICKGDGFFLGSCFAVIQKNPTSIRGGIFDIGFQYLHTVIHLGNCSGNYLVNATATYLPLPSWRPVTLKPRPSPTKRTGT